MKTYPITGAGLVSVKYCPETHFCDLEYKSGQVYRYANVQPGSVAKLMFATNRGAALHAFKTIYGASATWLNDPRECRMIGVVEGGAK